MHRILTENAHAFDVYTGLPAVNIVSVVAPTLDDIVVEDGQVNFEYADMVDRMEKMSRTVIGRRKKKRRIETGVTPADRVDRGEVKYIVLHASGGATGKPRACEGTVAWLLRKKTAAHFMVCRDGRVIRMVKIENIANHVKTDAINRTSVGIETESGQPGSDNPFVQSDWSPSDYWRMYASIAWLIRAIAQEVDLPRDRSHIITHEEADRSMARAHVDPGPFFESGRYPEFDARFPGEAVTPRDYLMRLVADDVPPQIWMVAASGARDEVEFQDTNALGLAHIRVWRQNTEGKAVTLTHEWTAPSTGMPPISLRIPMPLEPGSYRIVARDLVGNTNAALLKVPEPLGGALATTAKASLLLEPLTLRGL